jgi:hypothetical protein
MMINQEIHERHEKILESIMNGIVRELLELKEMIG